jgi:hypothetical protein
MVASGGDDISVGLLPHQLRELAVMAGLDPASSLTHRLVEALLACKLPATGRISYDAFLKVALHFRDRVRPTSCGWQSKAGRKVVG